MTVAARLNERRRSLTNNVIADFASCVYLAFYELLRSASSITSGNAKGEVKACQLHTDELAH